MCKVQRLFREEVHPSGWKRSPQRCDDIVCSAWKHVAVHKRTVAELTSCNEHKVTYGMGRETFIQYAYDMYGIKFTQDEAATIISKFFKSYPGLKKYHNMVGSKMRRGGYMPYTALDYQMKPKMYTEAINGPTQGTGGECMRLAIHLMVKKDRNTLKYIVNSIHDALYLIVPEVDKDYWGQLLTEGMQEAWYEIRKSKHFKWHDVPMNIDLMFGYNMGELEEDFSGGGQALTVKEMREQQERNKARAKHH